jgi:hypothetical protein
LILVQFACKADIARALEHAHLEDIVEKTHVAVPGAHYVADASLFLRICDARILPDRLVEGPFLQSKLAAYILESRGAYAQVERSLCVRPVKERREHFRGHFNPE